MVAASRPFGPDRMRSGLPLSRACVHSRHLRGRAKAAMRIHAARVDWKESIVGGGAEQGGKVAVATVCASSRGSGAENSSGEPVDLRAITAWPAMRPSAGAESCAAPPHMSTDLPPSHLHPPVARPLGPLLRTWVFPLVSCAHNRRRRISRISALFSHSRLFPPDCSRPSPRVTNAGHWTLTSAPRRRPILSPLSRSPHGAHQWSQVCLRGLHSWASCVELRTHWPATAASAAQGAT